MNFLGESPPTFYKNNRCIWLSAHESFIFLERTQNTQQRVSTGVKSRSKSRVSAKKYGKSKRPECLIMCWLIHIYQNNRLESSLWNSENDIRLTILDISICEYVGVRGFMKEKGMQITIFKYDWLGGRIQWSGIFFYVKYSRDVFGVLLYERKSIWALT